MNETICPYCGNADNFHDNLDYSQKIPEVINTLCNECGEYFIKE